MHSVNKKEGGRNGFRRLNSCEMSTHTSPTNSAYMYKQTYIHATVYA